MQQIIIALNGQFKKSVSSYVCVLLSVSMSEIRQITVLYSVCKYLNEGSGKTSC